MRCCILVFHSLAAPYERNLSVIIRLGAMPCFFNRLISRRLAALVFQRFWTISCPAQSFG
jgi:hypothetical protein